MRLDVFKQYHIIRVHLTKINFAGATADISYFSSNISTQEMVVGISAENKGFIKTTETSEYCNGSERQNITLQEYCEEYHQLLLSKTILNPDISHEIFRNLEPIDIGNAALFVSCACFS